MPATKKNVLFRISLSNFSTTLPPKPALSTYVANLFEVFFMFHMHRCSLLPPISLQNVSSEFLFRVSLPNFSYEFLFQISLPKFSSEFLFHFRISLPNFPSEFLFRISVTIIMIIITSTALASYVANLLESSSCSRCTCVLCCLRLRLEASFSMHCELDALIFLGAKIWSSEFSLVIS